MGPNRVPELKVAAHQSVVNVMDAARRANLPRLTFATQLPADAPAR